MKTLFDGGFARHNLYAMAESEVRDTARQLRLPHLAPFLQSIARLQMAPRNVTVRSYLRELVQRGCFEIRSPSTGAALRSGASLLLTDKSVLFCCPDEPTLFLAVGDLGQGFPICAAVLADRKLLLGLAPTDWGFSERHLPKVSALVAATGWQASPARTPLQLVLGDMNFAHHAWNQLSALEELLGDPMPDIGLILTQEPLGPLREIFPELSGVSLIRTTDVELERLNASGALFAPAGSRRLTRSTVDRILGYAEAHTSERGRALRETLSAICGPVLWMSVRTRNRTATNQHELLAALGHCFLQVAPHGAIVIDGHSLPNDIALSPAYHREAAENVVRMDRGAAERVKLALDREHAPSRVHIGVGLPITDSILLAREADIYFCHHGTVQHKIGWFRSVPGVAHCNPATLAGNPADWVASQSEVALPPRYLSPAIVTDAGDTPGNDAEYNDLLHHENYTVTDIPAAIATVLGHAAETSIPLSLSREEIMELTTSMQEAGSSVLSAWRAPNRHLIAPPDDLTPAGVEYTDFFRFLDAQLRPRTYFEIGTHLGRSLKAFTCRAVCVDPHFIIGPDVLAGRPETHLYQMTSDAYFAEHDLRAIFRSGPDICFLDGMHRCEYLLRDFSNTERHCDRRSIILMHDCLPVNARMALRTHEPGDPSEGPWQHAWTGDVWKIVPLLRKHRPDLKLFILDCAPTGLVAVSNLDPDSQSLSMSYTDLLDELREMDLDTYSMRRLWSDLPVISSRSLMDSPEDLTLFMSCFR